MKSKKRVLSMFLALVLMCSLIPMAAFADSMSTLVIESVTYTDDSLTASAKVSNISKIVYSIDGVEQTVEPAANQQATLTVDGDQYDIAAGSTYRFTDDAGITLTTKDDTNKSTNAGPGGMHTYYFRSAAFLNNGSLLDSYSVSKAIKSGTVTSTEANDVVINSLGSFFNGFYINDSDYKISNLTMNLEGDGGDDFSGWGAGATITGNSNVTIDKADITSKGDIRTAIWAGGTSKLNVTNSVIHTFGTTADSSLTVPMMKQVPWALGLEGTLRATNVLGGATANYSDSIIVADGWGALSTDSGRKDANALNVSDSLAGIGYIEEAVDGKDYDAVKTVNGIKYGFTIANSGYVTYADSGVINNYEDVQFYAPDYDIILASNTSSANFTGEDTVVVSNRIGAMWHQNKGGTLSLKDGKWTASDIMFLAKSGSANPAYPILTVDGTDLSISGTENYSGVLYQLMESDDAGGIFASSYTIPEIENDWSQVAAISDETTAAQATFKDVTAEGDIYNSVYNVNQDLDVTLDDSTITGTISSSNANHADEDGNIITGGTVIDSATDSDAYLYAGRIINTSSSAVNNDVNLVLDDSTWIAEGTSYLSHLTLDDDSIITAKSGYLVTLVVNGKETKIAAGDYDGNIVVKVTPYLGKIGSFSGSDPNDFNYRTALYVNGSGIVNENSVLDAITTTPSSIVHGNGVDNITVNSSTSGFSSIIVENNNGTATKYFTIKDSVFNALSDSDGSDVSDFSGYGSTISAYGDVNLTIDDVDVTTTGVAKPAFLADNGADILVTDSTFSVLGGTLYDGYLNTADVNKMVAPPWVLGISGNARGTNLLGENSTSTFVDSDFETTGWGVLSVDSGQNGVINVINSTLKNISNTGYGVYAIGGAVETFYGTTFNTGTYPVILTGGDIKFTTSKGIDKYSTVNGVDETVFNDIDSSREDGVTTVNSQFGVMAHDSGSVILEKGTVFNTKNAAFLIKSGVVDITVDDSKLNVEDGTILQMIDNDDTIVGANMNVDGYQGPVFNTVFNEAEGYPTEPYTGTETQDAVTATFTNVDLNGNMYNATGYLAQAKNMDVILGSGAALKGAISSTSAIHTQMQLGDDGYYYDYVKDADGNYVQATSFTINEYYQLGHVANKSYFNGYNTVSVALTDNAVWTVTGESALNSLSIGKDASVIGKMTVDGAETDIVPGDTYTGTIVIKALAENEAETPDTNSNGNGTSTNTLITNNAATNSTATGDNANYLVWIILCGVAVVFGGVYYFWFFRRKTS
jgi:hypothetical protein